MGGEFYLDGSKNTLSWNGTPNYINADTNVKAGFSDTSDANNNSLNFNENDSTRVKDIYAGYSRDENALNNILSIKNAKVNGSAYGGYAKKNAKYNKVIINGGDFGGGNHKIYGGYSETDGEASENIVNIEGGLRQELIDIYGGSSDSGKAINNSVNLNVDNLTLGRLYGGYVQNGSADKFSGNTLTLSGKNITANNVENFERLNFYIPIGLVPNTDKMLTLEHAPNLAKSKIGVGMMN